MHAFTKRKRAVNGRWLEAPIQSPYSIDKIISRTE